LVFIKTIRRHDDTTDLRHKPKMLYRRVVTSLYRFLNMDETRKQINTIDALVIALLGKRMKFTKKIGKLKKKAGLAIWDKKREMRLRKIYKAIGKKDGLSEEFIDKLFDVIFDESRRLQKE